jgi:hypothetical protein
MVPEDGAEPTFPEFASRWFAMAAPELRESTADLYKWHLSDHLLPFFQHHRLSDITVAEVDHYRQHKVRERDLLRARREAGEPTSHRPLGNETINKTRLGQVLDLAVEYGHLPANPARGQRRKLRTADVNALVKRRLIERRDGGFVPRRHLLEAFLPIAAEQK